MSMSDFEWKKEQYESRKLEGCSYCCYDPSNRDFSSARGVGKTEKGVNIYIDSGISYRPTPVNIHIMKWNEDHKQNETIGYYVPKYCPECGRRLDDNIKYLERIENEKTKI